MNSQLAEAWGLFLNKYSWDWFTTLTFRDPVPSFRAHRFLKGFVEEIDKAAGLPIYFFRADEFGPRGGRLHMHLLVGNVAHLLRFTWMEKWAIRAGYARVLPFDRSRGAAFYCAKYVTKDFADWEIVGLPTAAQLTLPLHVPQSGNSPPPRCAVNNRSAPHHQSITREPEVRRHRPPKLYWTRRDWEDQMIQMGRRWEDHLF
jgi:hypothetical protein